MVVDVPYSALVDPAADISAQLEEVGALPFCRLRQSPANRLLAPSQLHPNRPTDLLAWAFSPSVA